MGTIMTNIEKQLWDLRLKVIRTYEKYLFEKSIKSSQDKISGFNENGCQMTPEAMQQIANMIDHARETNNAIENFGRSYSRSLPKRVENNAMSESQEDAMFSRFGRSKCTSKDEPATASELVEQNILRPKKDKFSIIRDSFIDAMKELEKFMQEHNFSHSFRCKNEHLSDEDISKMISEANSLIDSEERSVALNNIKKIQKQTLFQFCTNKPYQCMVCPYYYGNMEEFLKMKELRKEDHAAEEE